MHSMSRIVESNPSPSEYQLPEFHFAMQFAVMFPATVKFPPARTEPSGRGLTAKTEPLVPVPRGNQSLLERIAMWFAEQLGA